MPEREVVIPMPEATEFWVVLRKTAEGDYLVDSFIYPSKVEALKVAARCHPSCEAIVSRYLLGQRLFITRATVVDEEELDNLPKDLDYQYCKGRMGNE